MIIAAIRGDTRARPVVRPGSAMLRGGCAAGSLLPGPIRGRSPSRGEGSRHPATAAVGTGGEPLPGPQGGHCTCISSGGISPSGAARVGR